MNAIESIKSSLFTADGKTAKKIIKEQAIEYENTTLCFNEIPEACIDLLVDIFSIKDLYLKDGIEIFVMIALSDIDRLTLSQKSRLLSTFIKHYHLYANTELCWIVCDMISRHYSMDEALRFFGNTFHHSTEQGKKGIALGLDVIVKQQNRASDAVAEAKQLITQWFSTQ